MAHRGENEICLKAIGENSLKLVVEDWPIEPNLGSKLLGSGIKEIWDAWAASSTKHLHVHGTAETGTMLLQYVAKSIKLLGNKPELLPHLMLHFMLVGMSLQQNGKLRFYLPEDMPHRKHCLCEKCAPELYEENNA